ncbi:MAG: hypothetical protein AUI16_16500 [Alphaproteobacteria bacterium 13_2_20CM_2_64_7]|jgi:hypothetical protein|nr:MAG: hypothetical protein AUI16_16500 [Alphaproteobacteria bacterium 13_2_20CM_2_64_7]
MLKLEIEGSWEPQDFIETLRSVESFYYKLALHRSRWFPEPPFWFDDHYYLFRSDNVPFEVVLDHVNQRFLERARYETPSDQRVTIRRIQYASPGGIDLLGIGKVVEVISDAIGRMKVYYDDKNIRRERDSQAALDTELKRLQIEKERASLQSIKIKNAKDALELLDSHPEAHEALLPLLVRDQDALADRIGERKLISAKVTSES